METSIENTLKPKKFLLRKIFLGLLVLIGLFDVASFSLTLYTLNDWYSWRFILLIFLLLILLLEMKKLIRRRKLAFWGSLIVLFLILQITTGFLLRSEVAAILGSSLTDFRKASPHPIFRVAGGSMAPAYEHGDYLLTRTVKNYQRGDVVAYNNTEVFGGEMRRFIGLKRIVAIPGDTIEIKNGQVFVNGSVLNESYTDQETTFSENTPESEDEVKTDGKFRFKRVVKSGGLTVILGEDTYFVLGDNRKQSSDSRNHGPIEKEQISGKVVKKLF